MGSVWVFPQFRGWCCQSYPLRCIVVVNADAVCPVCAHSAAAICAHSLFLSPHHLFPHHTLQALDLDPVPVAGAALCEGCDREWRGQHRHRQEDQPAVLDPEAGGGRPCGAGGPPAHQAAPSGRGDVVRSVGTTRSPLLLLALRVTVSEEVMPEFSGGGGQWEVFKGPCTCRSLVIGAATDSFWSMFTDSFP